ncbi:cytochrome ubiquinol oxidase subunit II [Paenibacillus sp. CAA11]|uniref:ubiquinol oxidase subunit II n=1 Tax=Paenibacillus sp. CAA11 TaxID=1532905 RepID=UPI000D344200|nr:ubiquinol oxidase subunit II [Paenibacillus sp. CAA11]AWB43585.1 cytochrome ubiquinol oxidase subunit II [Paenibacillus sp. CAA11]
MDKKPRSLRTLIAVVITVLTLGVLIWGTFFTVDYLVLDPKGPIGEKQKDLIIISTLLCSIVIVPVLILTAVIVWRYRDKPKRKAAYDPNWHHSTKLETIWWGVPIVIILVLGIVTAKYTYALEPSKPLDPEQKPVTVQVVSLNWKWLFLYPEEGIATVNTLTIPKDVPIRFEITADSPMNSFWIPQLGGQIYAMNGMSMTLYLKADEVGTYFGSGANFTGEQFTKMRFDVHAKTQKDYDAWVDSVKQKTDKTLTADGYNTLAKPGVMGEEEYSSFPEGIYNKIAFKYVVEGEGHHHGGGSAKGSSTEDQDMDMDMSGMDMSHESDASTSHAGH